MTLLYVFLVFLVLIALFLWAAWTFLKDLVSQIFMLGESDGLTYEDKDNPNQEL